MKNKAQLAHREGLLAEKYPEMAEEWLTPFNLQLGLDLNKVLCSYTGIAYWRCPKCNDIYRMSPRERCDRWFRRQESCYYCRGRRQKHPFTV